jgi:hypothetical protein
MSQNNQILSDFESLQCDILKHASANYAAIYKIWIGDLKTLSEKITKLQRVPSFHKHTFFQVKTTKPTKAYVLIDMALFRDKTGKEISKVVVLFPILVNTPKEEEENPIGLKGAVENIATKIEHFNLLKNIVSTCGVPVIYC